MFTNPGTRVWVHCSVHPSSGEQTHVANSRILPRTSESGILEQLHFRHPQNSMSAFVCMTCACCGYDAAHRALTCGHRLGSAASNACMPLHIDIPYAQCPHDNMPMFAAWLVAACCDAACSMVQSVVVVTSSLARRMASFKRAMRNDWSID